MKKKASQHQPTMQPNQKHSYILRLWSAEHSNWRASLEDPQTGERLGFSSLEQLFSFLMELSERENHPGS
jgi:hypothetical protein